MTDKETMAELDRLRASIDNFDAALVHILAERFRRTREVGLLKARHGMPALDAAREAAQAERLRGLAGEAGLDPAFVEEFFRLVVEEVRRNHRAIAEGNAPAESRDETA
ncbi:MAG: chorismate mutase [Rhizobiaceae bacterium]|nr:chorismate mutase [Rhizobiaceae bacterium]MCV0407676.1 chorismate mutase [Rhizobiaceae bacterium]